MFFSCLKEYRAFLKVKSFPRDTPRPEPRFRHEYLENLQKREKQDREGWGSSYLDLFNNFGIMKCMVDSYCNEWRSDPELEQNITKGIWDDEWTFLEEKISTHKELGRNAVCFGICLLPFLHHRDPGHTGKAASPFLPFLNAYKVSLIIF